MNPLHRRPLAESGLVQAVTPATAGWEYIHFWVYRLPPGGGVANCHPDLEVALILLEGQAEVTTDGTRLANLGSRQSLWERRPPTLVLLPPGCAYAVQALTPLHLAVAGAPASAAGSVRIVGPTAIVAEERGEGPTFRYIHHLLPPSALAQRLIVVEVYTPGGHWSSFPPHKHDVENPPQESYLEEIYYHAVRPTSGFALQRVYTDQRDVDVVMAVADGDLVLVPRGYHPVAAVPGHDNYYLNVMAGPSRLWNFQVDPAFAHLMNWQKPDVARG